MRRALVWGGVTIVLFLAYRTYRAREDQRLEYKWEMEKRATYETKKAEYLAIEAPFKTECADFIAIGGIDPAMQEAAFRKLEPRHGGKCDEIASDLNARSIVLRGFIERGLARERRLGIK